MARLQVNTYAALGVISATPCTLALLSGFNNGANARYFQVFNKATNPAGADVPVQSILVPAGSNFSWTPSGLAAPFTIGCSWGMSSTPSVFTAAAELAWVHAEGNSQ